VRPHLSSGLLLGLLEGLGREWRAIISLSMTMDVGTEAGDEVGDERGESLKGRYQEASMGRRLNGVPVVSTVAERVLAVETVASGSTWALCHLVGAVEVTALLGILSAKRGANLG
jgi:hypothetical protein